MRLTYFATTISFIAAVWAVPVDNAASGLYARKSDVFSGATDYLKTLAPPKPQGPTAMHRSRSTIAVLFMSAEEYRAMWTNVAIDDKPCSPSDLDSVKEKIRTFLDLAILKVPGLHVKTDEPPAIPVEGNCLAQWLPVMATFRFNVEDGMAGGLCEQKWCLGGVSLKSGNGFLTAVGHGKFYDTRTDDDRKEMQAVHAKAPKLPKHGDHS